MQGSKLISPRWPFCTGAAALQLMNVSCKGWLVLGPAKLGLLPDRNALTLRQSGGENQRARQTKDARHNLWRTSPPPPAAHRRQASVSDQRGVQLCTQMSTFGFVSLSDVLFSCFFSPQATSYVTISPLVHRQFNACNTLGEIGRHFLPISHTPVCLQKAKITQYNQDEVQSRAMIVQNVDRCASLGESCAVCWCWFGDVGAQLQIMSCSLCLQDKHNQPLISCRPPCIPSATEEPATGTVVESVVKRLRLPSEVKGVGGGLLFQQNYTFSSELRRRRRDSPFQLSFPS